MSDWEDFPDCRPEFIRAMNHAFKWAQYGPGVYAPVLHITKAQVVQKGLELGVPLELTWSCYEPLAGEPCGSCYSCAVRKAAGA